MSHPNYPLNLIYAPPTTLDLTEATFPMPASAPTVEATNYISTEHYMREVPPEPYVIVNRLTFQDVYLACRNSDNVLRWVTGKHLKMFGLAEAFENHGTPADPTPDEDTNGLRQD